MANIVKREKPWELTLSTGKKLILPPEVTPELLRMQREQLGMSVEEQEEILVESYQETAGTRRPYPVLNVCHSSKEAHEFQLSLGLADPRTGEAAIPIPMGTEIYAIVVLGTTMAACYGDEQGVFQNDPKIDKLRCLAQAPLILPGRGSPRLTEPKVIFETIWDGERLTCEGCKNNVFGSRDCKETYAIMSVIRVPELVRADGKAENPGQSDVPDLREMYGEWMPVMIKLSPTSANKFSGRSTSKEKAGYLTKVGAQRRALIYTVARLTIEKRRNDAKQKWGIVNWDIVDDPRELSEIGYPGMSTMALALRKELRESYKLMEESLRKYAESPAPVQGTSPFDGEPADTNYTDDIPFA